MHSANYSPQSVSSSQLRRLKVGRESVKHLADHDEQFLGGFASQVSPTSCQHKSVKIGSKSLRNCPSLLYPVERGSPAKVNPTPLR